MGEDPLTIVLDPVSLGPEGCFTKWCEDLRAHKFREECRELYGDPQPEPYDPHAMLACKSYSLGHSSRGVGNV